ncbi:MAG: hypothetical protein CMO55_06335 [Verrucomicrobiales bacterium]|nr:hypothetical protein [Verrucomicrobiales bacterium]
MAEDRILSLNIGSQQITGAVFAKTAGGGLRLDKLEKREFVGDPSDDATRVEQGAAALKEVVTALKAKGTKATYTVSSFPVLMKFASLPAIDGEQVHQIVEFEAQQQVPYPINEVAWGYQLVGDPDDIEVEVILAAVKSDELDEIDKMVVESGIKSQGAEVGPVALYNALRFNYGDVEGTTILVDIGARTTDIIFMEGNKLFIRTVKIGGSDITRAIAKEFGTDFVAADQRKVVDGFVALGGPYADHEDPEIAAISKVVRNSLTRLHSEIMRTITFYRSQQGGSAPDFMLLSGATSGLPFIREFFAEKLNLPVDHFNAFRNVTVGKGVDSDSISQTAHSLGEVVGGALSQGGEVPAALTLIPDSVQKEKDLQKRKVPLVIALLAVVAVLASLAVFFMKGTEITNGKMSVVESKAAELKEENGKIEDLKDDIERIDSLQAPYVEAVRHRVYWVRVFDYLGKKMQNDLIFMSTLEPLSNGQPIIEDEDSTQLAIVQPGTEAIIDSFLVKGFWREDGGRGSEVVYDYFKGLKADAMSEDSPSFFDLKEVDISEVTTVDAGTGGDRYAYPFEMVLPLPQENQVKFTK